MAGRCERLNIAHPAICHQIRQLEQEIGVAHFIRGERRIRLTDAVRVLLKKTTILLAIARKTYSAVEMQSRICEEEVRKWTERFVQPANEFSRVGSHRSAWSGRTPTKP